MFLRPLSAAVKVVSGVSAWISVHVERQPLASGAAELSLALSTSTLTVPTKVVATALFGAFLEMVARVTVVPASLVLITPRVAPAPVEVSNALKLPSTRRSARMCEMPVPALDEVAVLCVDGGICARERLNAAGRARVAGRERPVVARRLGCAREQFVHRKRVARASGLIRAPHERPARWR